MRNKIVMGNWKMNGDHHAISALLSGLRQGMPESVQSVVFPPHPYLAFVQHLLAEHSISVGAQDISCHESGAFTGEVSANMVRDLQCQYTLVGHSERRQYHHETNEIVADKFCRAQAAGLVPVLCVGETLAQRQAEQTEQVIAAQLQAVLAKLSQPSDLQQAVIAYEPVWAIGTGQTASPDQAQQVHAFIRSVVANHCPDTASKIQIVYGGSVKPDNAKALFALPDVDGGLVGGASLKAEDFIAIAQGV